MGGQKTTRSKNDCVQILGKALGKGVAERVGKPGAGLGEEGLAFSPK